MSYSRIIPDEKVPLRPVATVGDAGATAPPRRYTGICGVAEHLGVSESTAHRLRADPTFPKGIVLASKVVRYSIAEIDEWMQTRAPRATATSEPVALQTARETRRTGVIVRNGRITKETIA